MDFDRKYQYVGSVFFTLVAAIVLFGLAFLLRILFSFEIALLFIASIIAASLGVIAWALAVYTKL